MRRSLPRRSTAKAFESLYRRHLSEIYGYALALLDNPPDAEDATQTTFLNAYRALERGERPRHPAAWLRTIALNVCREQFRRARRRPDEQSLDDDPADAVVEVSDPAIGDVVQALSQLPFNQRAALVMREFEGRPLGEIATALEVSGSAVESLLFRARRGLREQLEGTLRCDEAERAISRQLDGALPRSERGALRAHLRACPECASLARRLRAQRSAVRSLALLPVPAALEWSKLAPASAASASGVSLASAIAIPTAAKLASAAAIAALAVGAGYATLGRHSSRHSARRVAADAPQLRASLASLAGKTANQTNRLVAADALHVALGRPTRGASQFHSPAFGAPKPGRIHPVPAGRAVGHGSANPGRGHGHANGNSGGAPHGHGGGPTNKPHKSHGQPPGHGPQAHGKAKG